MAIRVYEATYRLAMGKQAEINYFKNMTDEGRLFAANKPFSAEQRGAYLIDIGQILSLLPKPPCRLLDIGCGSGWTTAMFAKSGYDSLGVDIAPAAIELAKSQFGSTGASFEVQDFEKLPFDNCFDAVVIYDCLHHADDPQAVINAAYRVLRRGGETVIMEPGRGHHDSELSQSVNAAHGTTENDMHPSIVIPLIRNAGFASSRVYPRAQYQLTEKNSTGGIASLLQPVLGKRLASIVKTIKNSLLVYSNGVVWARK